MVFPSNIGMTTKSLMRLHSSFIKLNEGRVMSRQLHFIFYLLVFTAIVVVLVCNVWVFDTDLSHHFFTRSKSMWGRQTDSREPLFQEESCLEICIADHVSENPAVLSDGFSPHSGFNGLLNVEDTMTSQTRGYMISFRFYEQQTQASRNLLQFQCLADSIGSVIVEPFIVESLFSIPFHKFSLTSDPTDEFLTLTDLVDTELWKREVLEQFGYQAMTSWRDFIENAPKNIIIHSIRYRKPPLNTSSPERDYEVVCPDEYYKQFDPSLQFLGRYGFKLVRKSCSDFTKSSEPVPMQTFVENIFGKYKASEVTVLINQFRGLFGFYRLPVLSECGIKHHTMMSLPLMPSVRIQTDAWKYSKKVFDGRPYVAILARMERVVLRYDNIDQCMDKLDSVLKQLKASHKISDIFLAMDVGKFGSRGAAAKNLQTLGETLFQHLYQEKWSFKEWEDSFERVASSNNPAYVANLQRTIAANGNCIIMFGGGGFQVQARLLYEKIHPDSQCVYQVCFINPRGLVNGRSV